ncbi:MULTISPECIES: hypothetical protein [Herbaspirillum]|jgi:hypothetical protein|uniref:Uncharacterized protein n=1 Tax=Herbaspirillum aquaticum TaxID=568783 RepID=A0A225SUL9_9BURK|nr:MULTISPECIES: hypothetical protein [Herbaspirillum]MBW9336734.1 hypothetical protein [Herbaspirillum sp. RU 5E]MRT30632.1 hypothetical protein [Herbaspirillum sp. CAH-3]OWY34812.1 hypothetical protein CEJ45_11000 [Herbaspirillum aquaticum]
MSDQDQGMTHEERKRKILAQGALYRLGVMEAREVVRENLSAESLAKGAMSRVGHFAASLFGGGRAVQSIKSLSAGGLGNLNLQTVTPLLMTGASLLSRRWLRKPLMMGGVIAAVGGLAYYFSQRGGSRDQPDTVDAAALQGPPEPD